ncbi:MAG: GntR family transcriptional regulator [Pseudorhodoplanes sp.]
MSTEMTFATAQQEAYGYLLMRILNGDLVGGDRINPAEIAEILGISRMPVREALRQLDAEGLVMMRPNRSAVVTSLSAIEVDELFEIRTALEVMAVRYTVERLSADSLAMLVALKEAMDRVRHDPAEWIRRHDDLHQAICDLGNRNRLSHEISRIRLAIRPYLLMYVKVFNTIEMPGFEHTVLLDAIATRDVEVAQQAMREHVANPAVGLVSFLRQRELEADENAKKPRPDGRRRARAAETLSMSGVVP